MKLKTKIFAVAVCAMALCAALVGCAGSAPDDASNFQGDWMLSGGFNNGQELDADAIAAMEQMGLYVYVQLNEDGTAVMSLFGTNVDGTWKAEDATTATIEAAGVTRDVVLEGDELVMTVDDNSLRFKKGDIPADALAAADSATDEAGQAAE